MVRDCVSVPGSRRPKALAGSLAALGLALALGACAALSTPDNATNALYDPEKSTKSDRRGNLTYPAKACPPPGTADFIMPSSMQARRTSPSQLTMRYSPGDRFNIFVFGSTDFSGDYMVNADGTVVLPYAGQVEVVGLTNAELGSRIEGAYVKAGIFQKHALRLTTRPVQYAPINVTVAGAVFNPGRHGINSIRDSDKLDKVLAKFGDSPTERFVGAALRAAGGVRPDADVSAIRITRNGRAFTLDWRGAISGFAVDDMPLIEGDHVEVPESGCFQSALVRPTQITPPGIRVFVSNLATPVLPNATSSSPQVAGSMPYGSRLLQGLVNANCVGGTLSTNAPRYAVLISRNPKTRQTEVIQRPVEELVRGAHRDAINPFLMPDDAIACYDSTVSEFRDIMATMTTILTPAQIGKSLR